MILLSCFATIVHIDRYAFFFNPVSTYICINFLHAHLCFDKFASLNLHSLRRRRDASSSSWHLYLLKFYFRKMNFNFRKMKFNFRKMKFNFRKMKFNFRKMKFNFRKMKFNFRKVKLNSRKMKFNFRKMKMNFRKKELNSR